MSAGPQRSDRLLLEVVCEPDLPIRTYTAPSLSSDDARGSETVAVPPAVSDPPVEHGIESWVECGSAKCGVGLRECGASDAKRSPSRLPLCVIQTRPVPRPPWDVLMASQAHTMNQLKEGYVRCDQTYQG